MILLLAVIAVAAGIGYFVGMSRAGDTDKLEQRIVQAQARIRALDSERQGLRSELEQLREEASQAVTGDVERLLAQKDSEWKKELNRVRIEAEIEKVKRVEELEREVRQLKMDQRMRAEIGAAVENMGEIPEGVAEGLTPRARQVCAKLLELEGLPPEIYQVKTDELAKQLGARSLVRVGFGNGSAFVGTDDETALRVAVADTEDYSLLLAVGFADTGGDAELNRELGTQRARNVGDALQGMIRRGQMVESIYLGETARFGENRAANRTVEVWELRR
ncbi:MAG: hypothetical protein Q7Q71_13690 [Verrucomicrobiota bacterium JB023]|nr:hypothetical protein [Verrucomicrobiota bacterium JB023]